PPAERAGGPTADGAGAPAGYAVLRAADAARIAAAHETLLRPQEHLVRFGPGDQRTAEAVRVSADGRTVAALLRNRAGDRWHAAVFRLPDGERPAETELAMGRLTRHVYGDSPDLVRLGAGFAVAGDLGVTLVTGSGTQPSPVVPWQTVVPELRPAPEHACIGLHGLPDGNALAVFAPTWRAHDAPGVCVRLDPGLRPLHVERFPAAAVAERGRRQSVAGPDGTRVAIRTDDVHTVHQLNGGPTHRIWIPQPASYSPTAAVFTDDDTLAVLAPDRIWVRHLTPDGPRSLHAADVSCDPRQGFTAYDGLLLFRDRPDGALVAVRADTLAPAKAPPAAGDNWLDGTPDGHCLTSGGRDELRVALRRTDALHGLARRPLEELEAGDLALLEAELRRDGLSRGVREYGELLRACLLLRFGDEVAVRADVRGAAEDVAVRPDTGGRR
ncbi:hypothetical protein AB0M28_32035, partial [Streptomyces sp. NPDC051940]|uniref:hypothetical protein n=1 Tax=Streptomyces sp. NPDC051940 TaxID=3155675 RepID=UPI00341B0468